MKSILTKKVLLGVVVLPLLFSGVATAQVVKPEGYLVDDRPCCAGQKFN